MVEKAIAKEIYEVKWKEEKGTNIIPYCLIVEEQATKCVTKRDVKVTFVAIWSIVDVGWKHI
jgi:hypothetical protein